MTLQFDPISTAQIACGIISVVVVISGLFGLMIVRKAATQERSIEGTTVICVYSLLHALVTVVCLIITSCQMPGCTDGGVYRLQYQSNYVDQLQSEKGLLEAKLKVAESEKK